MWFNRFGQEIFSEARGLRAGYQWPQVSIHPGVFQRILFATVIERLGADVVFLDHYLSSFSQKDDKVRAEFVSKEGDQPQASVEGDLLIAADGIHSVVRQHYYPTQGSPRWAGSMMWRMTAELNEPVLGGNTMFSAGTGDLKVVGYEISATAKARGRSLFNWVAEARVADVDAPLPEREDSNRGAKIADFIGRFKEMKFDWFDPTAVAKESSSVWAFPMVDRDPVDRWTFGRVTLLGDAAHPMRPSGSNGASQSVLDCRERPTPS